MLKRCASPVAIATAIFLLAGCVGGSSSPATPPASQQSQTQTVKHDRASCPPCLYVANSGGPSITVYPVGAKGDVAPVQYLNGSLTRLSAPSDIAVDSGNNMYVANQGNSSVHIYAAGATGNVRPAAVIKGSKTGLHAPDGVAVDPVNGDIYVANLLHAVFNGTITAYAAGSNGNVAPVATITGTKTGLASPGAIAVDPSGNIYVPNAYEDSVTVYAAGSSGNVAPMQTIAGGYLNGPIAVSLDSSLNIWVANYAANIITAYAAGGTNGNDPIQVISESVDDPQGVALDANGDVYAANTLNNTITIYSVSQSGVNLVGTIKGKKTDLKSPRGIAIR